MAYWKLPKLGREYYTVEIITQPQLSAWEITFDQGENWYPMDFDTESKEATILVSGPNFQVNSGDTTEFVRIETSTMPYIRAQDTPEVIVRTTPKIDLV